MLSKLYLSGIEMKVKTLKPKPLEVSKLYLSGIEIDEDCSILVDYLTLQIVP